MEELTIWMEKAALLHDLIDADIGEGMFAPLLSADSDWAGDTFKKVMQKQKGVFEESSRIAMGTHYRLAKEKPHVQGALNNVFNVFRGSGTTDPTVYPVSSMESEVMLYPLKGMKASSRDLDKIRTEFWQRLSKKSLDEWTINQLTRLMEIYLSRIPVSDVEGLSDISFYDHAKLSAAYAVCMGKYLEEKGLEEADYAALRKEPAFLMVSGDVSGIQKFIYTIPSKGALKSLRGRSFYLEILLENVVDEILGASGVSRTCLLYTGGGHFYLLLPNTDKVKGFLREFSVEMNGWFLKQFGSLLYLAMAWTPCTAHEFMEQAGDPFQRVSQELSREKLCRYNEDQLREMFSPESNCNRTLDGARECGICHSSSRNLSAYHEDDEVEACQTCRNLFRMGERMLRNDVFLVSTEEQADALPLPGMKRSLFLYSVAEGSIAAQKMPVTRLYLKNRVYSDHPQAVCLWMADYSARESGQVLEFEKLAARSGGDESLSGIRRLGVLRADVDNLGAAFLAGFPEEYASLSRTAVLSRQLSIFFKCYMNYLCKGEVNGKNEQKRDKFSLFGRKKKQERDVHVVYSGGDDVFLVGAWDDLIELAVDIRRAFARFTGGKLTFSSGIGFFPPNCPVHIMAQKTGELEDAAKGNPGKDSIALFGAPSEIHGENHQADRPQCFSWKDFTDKVCREKLDFLLTYFPSNEEEKLLPIGKSWLYRVLALLDSSQSRDGEINLARFAYVLARLDPGDKNPKKKTVYGNLRERFYQWYRNEEERKELRTAIELLIYYLRETEEEG